MIYENDQGGKTDLVGKNGPVYLFPVERMDQPSRKKFIG